ncbi:MAG: exodeoxyribonuclease III [Oscillospiraceae bacterium]|nr:exodeoxyribonuclease III [Oscillospiraceae bacterium]
MKLVSWNVNGLRACIQKGFLDFFNKINADFFCLQETKLQEGQIELDLPGYEQYWCYAEKKGYSGTAIFTKHTPMSVRYGLGIPELDTEGRLITLEYPEFYLVTCYTPNAQRELARIEHRMKWEDAFRAYLIALDEVKPVILCGDLNVAHQEIDLKNPASNRGSAGFSDQERSAFTRLLESGFTDTFRHLNPDATGCYTWWSYMFNARKNNAGWRIDYFVVSDRLKEAIYSSPIHSDILGSDHCPVELELGISCNGSIWKSDAEGTAKQIKQDVLLLNDKTKKAVVSGFACLLLALGFAAGFFTNQFLNKPEETASLENSKPLDDDIISVFNYPMYITSDGIIISCGRTSDSISKVSDAQAKGMSTEELIGYAVQIPELLIYNQRLAVSYVDPKVLTPHDFEEMAETYPALAELATREDAGIKMVERILFSSDTNVIRVLNLLLTLDIFKIEGGQAENKSADHGVITDSSGRIILEIPLCQ